MLGGKSPPPLAQKTKMHNMETPVNSTEIKVLTDPEEETVAHIPTKRSRTEGPQSKVNEGARELRKSNIPARLRKLWSRGQRHKNRRKRHRIVEMTAT